MRPWPKPTPNKRSPLKRACTAALLALAIGACAPVGPTYQQPDVLLTPDRRCRVLDEDELPDDLDTRLQIYIDAARDRLVADSEALLDEFGRRSAELLAGS